MPPSWPRAASGKQWSCHWSTATAALQVDVTTAEGLGFLAACSQLRRLHLAAEQLPAKALLLALAAHPRLRELSLESRPRGCARGAWLGDGQPLLPPNLTLLHLRGSSNHAPFVSNLGGQLTLLSQLRSLAVERADLSDSRADEALAALAQLTLLTHLELRHCGMLSLPSFTTALEHLVALQLGEPDLESIEHLGGLQALTRLELRDVNTEDVQQDPLELAQLTRLRSLDVSGCDTQLPHGAFRARLTRLVAPWWVLRSSGSNPRVCRLLRELRGLPHIQRVDFSPLHLDWTWGMAKAFADLKLAKPHLEFAEGTDPHAPIRLGDCPTYSAPKWVLEGVESRMRCQGLTTKGG
ncbi:TMV resistance N [Micractinium conductrix]|uniref:TMV resistance N n=1 Tax=Micractinium conductrix TaxID=554055 RepID=A0A2P6V5U5_9CHLO|nr:TMV resistance N [Micractinium conductrix]|eukprot:PSC69465.1 TMV resistance N [Micractinium conductrix]